MINLNGSDQLEPMKIKAAGVEMPGQSLTAFGVIAHLWLLFYPYGEFNDK